MADDKVKVANLALGKIGSQAITSLTQSGSNEAIAINNVYDDILEEVLSEHPWSFAQRRATLVVVVADDVSRTIDEEVFTPLEITNATKAKPVVITSNAHGLQNGEKIVIEGVAGMIELNSNSTDFFVSAKTNDKITLVDANEDDIDGSSFTAYTNSGQIFKTLAGTPIIITAATKANPVKITTASAHGLSDDDWIKIIGVNGMTDLNDKFFIVDDATTTTFTLNDTSGANVDGSAFSAFTYGGRIYKAPEMVQTDQRANDIVVYQKPSDLIKVIKKSDINALVNIEQDKIISDVNDLLIKYTYRNVTVSQYSKKFVQALATRLASEIAFTIVNSVSKAKDLMDLYLNSTLPKAISTDSTEGSPDEPQQDEWLIARRRGSFPFTTGQTWHPA